MKKKIKNYINTSLLSNMIINDAGILKLSTNTIRSLKNNLEFCRGKLRKGYKIFRCKKVLDFFTKHNEIFREENFAQ